MLFKKQWLVGLIAGILMGTGSMLWAQNHYVGEKITPEGAVSVEQALKQLEKEGKVAKIKVQGKVSRVCQKKGCWMVLTDDDGHEIRVVFKDYSFFVPKDIAGYEAIAEGALYYETISVQHLRHLAKDAGKSEEEIAKITEPERIPTLEAHGVIIRNYAPKKPTSE